VALAVAALAGCGGGSERSAAPPPRLPAALASQLAQRSDRVAALLEVGQSCPALDEARRLHEQTIAAINTGRVPGPLQEQLSGAVGDLVDRIHCVPPPRNEDEDKKPAKDHEGKDHKGKDHKGKDGGDHGDGSGHGGGG
jgi:hypothetical protein